MEYRKLGGSDLKVSAITYGAWAIGGWMWGTTDRKNAVEAIKTSYDLDVTSIDTAPAYGQGLSEEIVGEAIKDIPRDKIQILTKYGMVWDRKKGEFFFKSKDNNGKDIDIYKYSDKENVMKECEDSLRRLGTDYIDLYQVHWHDPTTSIDEPMEAVSRLIEQGKVRYAGVCNYNIEQMKKAQEAFNGQSLGDKFVSNQVPFSMVLRDIEDELVPYCIKNSKAILAYSPLQKGLLTGKIKPGQSFHERDHRRTDIFFTSDKINKINLFLEKIKPLADGKNATLAQLTIRWTIERPGITIALVGARNAKQAEENAKAINVKLSKDEIEFINKNLYELTFN